MPPKSALLDRRRPRPVPARPLVLIVDDDADTREMYSIALSILEFDAIGVGSRAEANGHAWALRPDVIVTDLSLSDGDGWDLIQNLKGHPRTRDIPVVVLSGHAPPSPPALHRYAAFLLKPCLPDDLATALRAVLADDQVRSLVVQ